MHRVMKDKAKLLKANSKASRKELLPSSDVARQPAAAAPSKATPVAGKLLNSRRIRALEKDLMKKANGSKSLDFSAYYKGNVFHVSVNSDSDSSESSAESFDEL